MVKAFSTSQFVSSIAQPQREENVLQPAMSRADGHQQNDGGAPRSQNLDSTVGSSQGNPEDTGPEVQDPLAGMSDIDRWGLKGFTTMMNNFPDYAALVTGMDVASFGLDLSSHEYVWELQTHYRVLTLLRLISEQVYSLWDNEPPRPAIPKFKLPDCYTVSNVGRLDTKMTGFNDEALLFMFYSNPGDVAQIMAAQEL
jgi:CCR4-NOT transcription complex subunit 2